jgi:CHAT domain-containing protein
VFARDVVDLYALVLTRKGGALVNLKRAADGTFDYHRLEKLTSAFHDFELSFSWPKRNFDTFSANRIYDILFAPLTSHLDGVKRLVIIPDVSFPALAYPALVTEPSASDSTLTEPPWLVKKYTVSTALSLTSFVAVRSHPAAHARGGFLGLADPQIDNPTCAPMSPFGGSRDRGATAHGLCPIPQTLDHVAYLARGLGADVEASVIAGANLTKLVVLEHLAQPERVVAFATHGLTGTEMAKLNGLSEPALLLSGSEAGNWGVDQWLTMSDIETLSIDADLVLLSACNTSADGSIDGEAFSGLARAFFEAGARSMLITNWYIDVAETTEFLKVLAPMLGGSGAIDTPMALQKAMLRRMTDTPHPRDWAVFTALGG